MEGDNKPEDVETSQSAPSVLFTDISPDSNGGITKTIVKPGEGEDTPAAGCKVFVHYVGRLENGEQFDSSRDRGEPLEFQLGQGKVIKGWDIGVATMLKKEVCELKIASEYAYGDRGFPPKIPAGATLIFEIELLTWDDEDITKDMGVRKRLIKEGVTGGGNPNVDGKVKIHVRGTYQGENFDERDVEFIVGDGHEHNIVEGIEKGVVTMRRYEKAKYFIKPQYAFKEAGSEVFGIPANAEEIVYEVVLFDFTRAKEIYEMSYGEKVERATLLKERGLKSIKRGDHETAVQHYERLLEHVASTKDESDFNEGLPLRIAGNLNAALCYLKTKNFAKAKRKSEDAVELDGNNVKGHFRLGEALIGLKEYKEATKAYDTVLKLEPTNGAAKKQLDVARNLAKKQTEKEKKLYSSIFAGMGDDQS